VSKNFEFNISKEDYLRGLQAITKSIAAGNSNSSRHAFEQIAFLAAVAVIGSLLNPDDIGAVLTTMFLTMVGGCLMQVRWAKLWRTIAFDPIRARFAIALDEQGWVIRQPDLERRYSWTAVQRIHELPDLVILEFADWYAVPMPADLWAGPDERSKFVEYVRARATQLRPDLPKAGASNRSTLLVLFGATAAGLVAMVSTINRLGAFNNCGCAFRHSLLGQLIEISPILAYFVGVLITWPILKWLSRRWPRVGAAAAISFIVLFVVSLGGPPALQIYRFFSQPAP
jgi:hypothetical protein